MNVKPDYMSFGELFKNNNVFYTPKYQRDYSWEDEQIEQFCNDIKDALDKKNSRKKLRAFFWRCCLCTRENICSTHENRKSFGRWPAKIIYDSFIFFGHQRYHNESQM